MQREFARVSIVIPTFNREEVLTATIFSLLQLEYPAEEILVVDQTPTHQAETERQLQQWHNGGKIKWLNRSKPSITEAMNFGLISAKNDLVLFLDDDILPHPGLIENHALAHKQYPDLWASTGQVIQPWQNPEAIEPPRKLKGLKKDFDFPFNSMPDAEVQNVMAGNLCVNREHALAIGGFDENFVGPAYRFETDFARRIINAGGNIRFVSSAGIDHLRVQSGGTRTQGSHLTSPSPLHGFGDYYYAFKHGTPGEAWKYSLQRLFREVRTRFHLTQPWWIPVKLVGEFRAIIMALRSSGEGRKLIS
jgi:GT2 family glycosyltransferase